MAKSVLDAKRLLCPLPVIRTQDRIKTLHSGDVLEVVATDPGVMQDIPAWCRINQHQLLDSRSCDGEYILRIRVG